MKRRPKLKRNPRLGKCYELSGRYAVDHADATLIHGRLVNPFSGGHKTLLHAWIIEGPEIFDLVMDERWPKEVYNVLFQAEIHRTYTHLEVISQILNAKHWGPWPLEEVTA